MMSLLFLFALETVATPRYVVPPETPGAAPDGSYYSWATAATNIADAVAVATDTVLVSNGTYRLSSQIVITKGVTLQSYNNGQIDRDGTILDGQYPAFSNRCLYVNHASALIQGFTLTNGCPATNSYSGYGGGLYLEKGKARNCRIVGNFSATAGGGAYLKDNSTLLADSIISGNWVGTNSSGGGVYLERAATATNCVIFNNRAANGGGVSSLCDGATPSWTGLPALLDCTVSNNVAGPRSNGTGGSGGGVSSANFLRIDHCRIMANEGRQISGAQASGAGSYLGSGSLLVNSTVAFNKCVGSSCYGGGLCIKDKCIVSNCFISGNSSMYGGALNIDGTTSLVVDSRVVSNTTALFMAGGTVRNCLIAYNSEGVRNFNNPGGFFQNCTVVSNKYGFAIGDNNTIVVTSRLENCIVYYNGSKGTNYNVGANSGLIATNNCLLPFPTGLNDYGNTADDPQLIDYRNFDFRLRGTSPCINKGIYRDWMAGAHDLDGAPRIRGAAVDLGAFEYLFRGTAVMFQ